MLATLLFNLHIAELPKTISRKFGYTDELAIAVQRKALTIAEDTLTADNSWKFILGLETDTKYQ